MRRRDPKGIELEEYIEKNRKGLSLDGVLGDEYRKHDAEISKHLIDKAMRLTDEDMDLKFCRNYFIYFYDYRFDISGKEYIVGSMFEDGYARYLYTDRGFQVGFETCKNDVNVLSEFYSMAISYMQVHALPQSDIEKLKCFAANKNLSIARR